MTDVKLCDAKMDKKKAIESVIDTIHKSKIITKTKFKNSTLKKSELIKRIQSFTLQDFQCYAEDGNTAIEPDIYYSKLSLKNAKYDYELKNFQLEYEVDLLRCCNRCRDHWLRCLFELNYLREILNIPSNLGESQN